MVTAARAAIAAAMTEEELQANIIALCKVYGLLVYHTHDSRRSPAGFPDLVIVGPRGVLYRELKKLRGKCTPDQVRWLDALRTAGADASVWRPDQWPGRIREELGAIRG